MTLWGIVKLDTSPVGNNWNSTNLTHKQQSTMVYFNIGNNKPVKLMDYIDALEKALQKQKLILPLQQEVKILLRM